MSGGNPHTEAEFLRLIRRKDTSAARRIYDAYAGYLLSVCRRYIGDSDTSRDVLQDALVKIFSSLDKFEWRGEGSLRAWMRRIVVNESLMRLRADNRSIVQPSGDSEIPEIPDEEEPELDGIPMEVLQDMISSLPDGYRTVFNLYVFEEKSHREIASILGISENTSYSQFSRAKSLLAKKIKQYGENGQE